MTIEMTDLRKKKVADEYQMKEFVPMGKVNQTKKKRDKRKLKKMQELEKKAVEEAKRKLEEDRKLKEKLKSQNRFEAANADPVYTSSGKVLKKKVIRNKKIVDEQGEWEVINKKQTVIQEESASDHEDSD